MYFEFWMPVLICAAAALVIGLSFCIFYGVRSRHVALDLQQAAVRMEKQKRCSMQNMPPVDARIYKSGSLTLKEIWGRYKADADNLFGGEHAPDPAVYFTYEDLFEIPCNERMQSVLQFIFPSLAVISFFAPLAALFFSGIDTAPERVRACLAMACTGVMIIIALFIATFVYIKYTKQKNSTALLQFNNTLSALFPVINESTQMALLLHANQKNSEAFRDTARIIAEKIDDFTLKGITPLVTSAFEKSIEKHITPGIQEMERALYTLSKTVVERQDTGMRELAAAFAGSLGDSVSAQIKSMTSAMEALITNLSAFNAKTEENTRQLLDTLGADGAVLRETADISRAIASQQETTAQTLGSMGTALSRVEQVMDRIEQRDEAVFTGLSAGYTKITELQQQLDDQLKAGQEASKAAVEALSGTSAVISASVESLIANTAETGEKTYALIAEKLKEVLDATNASNAAAAAAVSGAAQAMLAGAAETSDKTYGLISEKLTQVLDAASASNTAAAAAVSDAAQAMLAGAAETSDKTYGLISEKLKEVLDTTSASNAAATAAIRSAVESLIASTSETGERTFSRISDKLTETLRETSASNENTAGAIRETAALLIGDTGKTIDGSFERIFGRLTDLLTETNSSNAETYDRISKSVESLTSTVGQTVSDVFDRYSGHLMDMLGEAVSTNRETSQKLASTMTSLALAGTEQYEKAAQAAAQLLESVVTEMNKAMDGVGHDIADSIREASLGSAEIVSRLVEKTAQLKDDYDAYFNRVENWSLTNLSEMEFRVQNVFARFSNDATNVMDKLEVNISKAVGLFEGNTTMLLQSMEEQSRSIGLYAKDLNIDVAALTESLRDSVGVFTEHLQDSTRKTFEEFDEGLAEVSARLANTVESIRESVENLPDAIRIKQ